MGTVTDKLAGILKLAAITKRQDYMEIVQQRKGEKEILNLDSGTNEYIR